MKKRLKVLCLILLTATLLVPYAAACASLTFKSHELPDAVVGKDYEYNIASAEGGVNITYHLGKDSVLPEGLTLDTEGNIAGVPEKSSDQSKFVVEARAKDSVKKAEFSLKVKSGAIVYKGSNLKAAIGKDNNISLATASDGLNITYTLKNGTLPEGLTLNSNGSITGKPVNIDETTSFTVTASAPDCASADANFKITVTLPWIEYTGRTLELGRVGEYYLSMLNTAKGAKNIIYSVHEDSAIPLGLTLDTNGILHGIPQERIIRYPITVVASASGYISAEVEFVLTTRAANQGLVGDGEIRYEGGELPAGYLEGQYSLESSNPNNLLARATASNRQPVNYSLKEGSKLPDGLKLYADGTLFGVPAVSKVFSFIIVANAEGCQPLEASFDIDIRLAKINYPDSRTIDMGIVGEEYNYSIADAEVTTEQEVEFVYQLKSSSTMPAGLTISPDGIISGTPQKSGKNIAFTIVVSGEGFSSVESEIFISIIDAVTVVADGRLEAEYMDLTGKIGSGYSGSTKEEGMVQPSNNLGGSNGYHIGFTHGEITLKFEFTSSKAVGSVPLRIALSSELGNITLTSQEFEIRVNGKAITYPPINLTGVTSRLDPFKDFALGNIALVEGVNSIELEVRRNGFKGGGTGGPAIDYIELKTDAVISWRPCLYNLNRFR